jgi:hypothetical protein
MLVHPRNTLPGDSGMSTKWTARDLLWIAVGLYIGGKVVVPVVAFSDLVMRLQSLILIAAAVVAAVFLPRHGILLPGTGRPVGNAAVELSNAKTRLRWLCVPLVAGYFALQLQVRFPPILVLAGFWILLAIVSSPILTRLETFCLCAAATVFVLDAPLEDKYTWKILAAAALIAAALLFALFIIGRVRRRRFAVGADRFRVWLVRGLAAIVIVSGFYQVVLGLVGEIIVIPLAVALSIAVAIAARRRARTEDRRHLPLLRKPIVLGLATFAASFGVIIWGGWVDHELSAAGLGTRDWGRGGAPYPATAGDPLEVAEAYEPLFVFADNEEWHPSDPVDYLRSGRVLVDGREIAGSDLLKGHAGAACVNPAKPRCVVTIKCSRPEMSCAEERDGVRRLVFARVVDKPLEREGFDRRRARPPLDTLTKLIQYWAFYRYDDWRRWPFDGWHQWHEGDWEWVGVGLSDSGPVLVAYSAHCGGNWRRWERVGALAGTRDAAGLHPLSDLDRGHHALAFIGKGTHAAYPDMRERAPNWDTCAKYLPAVAEAISWGPAHAIKVREVMPRGGDPAEVMWGPPVVLATALRPTVMRVRAYWGPANHLRTFWRGGDCPPEQPKKKCDRVGDTPPLKADWRRPIETIFCNPYWHPRGYCPPRRPAKTSG